jgi:uncharacterized protein YxjI
MSPSNEQRSPGQSSPIRVPTGDGTPRSRYQVKETWLPIGEDYVVEDQRGRPFLQVDGKLLSVRESLVIREPSGRELLQIRGDLLEAKVLLTISRGQEAVVRVRRLLEGKAQERFVVELRGGEEVTVVGSPRDREYKLNYAGHTVADVSKSRFTLRGAYGVEIVAGQDDALVLAIAICLHVMAHS